MGAKKSIDILIWLHYVASKHLGLITPWCHLANQNNRDPKHTASNLS